MIDIELPLGKRSAKYRFFEMLPGLLSYGAFILLIVLALWSPLLAAVYLLLVVITLIVKAVAIAYHMLRGRSRLDKAQKIDWRERLEDFENPVESYELRSKSRSKAFGAQIHVDNLRLAAADPKAFPKPSDLYNIVIIAAYNESYEVLEPTFRSLVNTTYDKDRLIVVMAYEERGGPVIEQTSLKLQKEFGSRFKDVILVKHPRDGRVEAAHDPRSDGGAAGV